MISFRNQNYTSCLCLLSKCPNLIIAYLQQNRLQSSDLSYLICFKELRKLDLSKNNLKSLPEVETLSSLIRLKEFYLHDNCLERWQTLVDLTKMGSLVRLTLSGNPVAEVEGYRHYVVNSMPNLL